MALNVSLNVPHISQIADGYCLPACVEMVLAYYGNHRSQLELAKLLDLYEGFGVPSSRITRLSSRQFDVVWRQGEQEDLLRALSNGIPLILEVATRHLGYWQGEDSQHVILLTALRELNEHTFAIVNDPAFDASITILVDELLLAWIERDNYLIEIRQK